MASSLLAERQAETELTSLKRSVRHAFTSLDVSRRKWASLSAAGKDALTACANGQSRLGHAEGAHLFAALKHLDAGASSANGASGDRHRRGSSPALMLGSAVRRGVAIRALQERHDSQLAVPPVMRGLEEVVAGMRRIVAELEARVAAAARVLGPERARTAPLVNTESATQLVARAAAMADAFARELSLRRAVTAEVVGAGREGSAARPGWDGAVKLYLSAWVLEPYVEHDVFEALLESLGGDEQPVRRRTM